MTMKKTPGGSHPVRRYQPPVNQIPQRERPFAEMPTQPWQPLPPPAPLRRTHWLVHLAMAMSAVLVLLFGLAVVLAAAWFVSQSDWIVPGVSVSGIDLSGQSRDTAVSTLQSAWDSQIITLAVGDETRAVPPSSLGFALDAAATADAARAQGRTLASWRAFWANNGRFLTTPVWQLDRAAAENGLNALAVELNRVPQDARLEYSNGRFVALPGQPGRQLDVIATLTLLEQQAGVVLGNGRLDLVLTAVPPVVVDLSAVAEQANTLLVAPITLHAYDPITNQAVDWALPPETWGGWLTVDAAAAAAGQFNWSLDQEQVGNYVQAQAAGLGEGRYVDAGEAGTAVTQAITSQNPFVSLRVYHQPRQHVVQSGETLSSIGRDYGLPYPWIQQANPGLGALSIGQTITIPSPDEMLPLPVVENKRIVVSIAQQRAWVYENGALVWDWPVSTGIADSPTAPGIFQIQSHEANAYAGNWDLWMPQFMGIYRPVPTSDFMNGFHGFPTRGGSQLLWTGDLGRPVTYGCILLDSGNAELLYNWAETGVVVEIQP
ncbi:MAG: L,D-transpeptidase family protein [Chloroflexi bacterium]|nr:L,D-transpeptidase family protein [Chloroflexota bacterium]MBP7043759.1 L,D-transpeptidase family protein [Chloroflexota bacterium]